MTDQPSSGSALPDPEDATTPAPPPPPPLAPLVGAASGTTPSPTGMPPDPADAPGTAMPPPAGWAPAEQAPAPPPPPAAPAATGKDKLRLFLILGGIAVFIGVVLFATMNNEFADQLAIGQCFDEPEATDDISTVEKHPCTEAHDAEVFHVAQMPGDSYPIDLAFQSFVETTCLPVFATYTGIEFEDAADLDVGWFYPNSDGWDSGKRTVTCYIIRVDGAQMTQSVKAGS